MHELRLHKITPDKSDQNCKMPDEMAIRKIFKI